MAEIIRSDGAVILIDDDDLALVSQFRWSPAGWKGRYVGTHSKEYGSRTLYLHRLLLNPDQGVEVDHKNRDPLDNHRSNLRMATRSQNEQNKPLSSRNTTGYRGVYRYWKGQGRFFAKFEVEGKVWWLCTFDSAEEASAAVEKARGLFMTHAPECVEAGR